MKTGINIYCTRTPRGEAYLEVRSPDVSLSRDLDRDAAVVLAQELLASTGVTEALFSGGVLTVLAGS